MDLIISVGVLIASWRYAQKEEARVLASREMGIPAKTSRLYMRRCCIGIRLRFPPIDERKFFRWPGHRVCREFEARPPLPPRSVRATPHPLRAFIAWRDEAIMRQLGRNVQVGGGSS